MTRSRPRGVIAATATPLNPDFTPDAARLHDHCRKLLDNGCNAINLLGTTGEATSFSVEQRIAVMRGVKDAGLPLDRFMVGTGAAALNDAVALTRAAADLGFAGALLIPPFYYKGIERDGLLAFIDILIKRVDNKSARIYLYHIPQNTGVPWPIEIVSEIKRRYPDIIVGLKDSAGDLAYARAVASTVQDFDVFPSAEGSLAEAKTSGFAGCISATTNITAPDAQIGWQNPDSTEGKSAISRASALRTAIATQPLIASVKAMLAERYNDANWMRVCPPLQSLNNEQLVAQRAAIARAIAIK